MTALALVACNGAGDETASSPSDLAADVGCLACHTETSTTMDPTLHGFWGSDVELIDGRVVAVDEEYVRKAISDPDADVVVGYGPTMARLPLDESEVDRLVGWVRSLG